MTHQERQSTILLASIYAFRMLGLFMILPIFSLYTHRLDHASAYLIGVALGAYGLTQAVLQIPFGIVSDRVGRKPVIIFGLVLFALGSVIAALSHGIYGIILGRIFQGAGAIGSTLIALLADTTEDENRLKAMSVIGMTIGFSFMLAMVLGPLLNNWVGLSGIFWLTALLAMMGILFLSFIPTPHRPILHRDSQSALGQLLKTIMMPELLRLNFGIFCLHAILMALFIAIPIILVNTIGLDESKQWILYLPVLILACFFMIPFVIIAEAKRLMKPIFVGAIATLTIIQIIFALTHQDLISISILLCIFFTTFTLLESILPSLVSKIAPTVNKGTAMGIYSSSQFLGIFFGGTLGGIIFQLFGNQGIFLFCASLGALWVFTAYHMKKPRHLSSKIVKLHKYNTAAISSLQVKLLSIPGVAEAVIASEEHVVYLKVDKREFVEDALTQVLANEAYTGI